MRRRLSKMTKDNSGGNAALRMISRSGEEGNAGEPYNIPEGASRRTRPGNHHPPAPLFLPMSFGVFLDRESVKTSRDTAGARLVAVGRRGPI